MSTLAIKSRAGFTAAALAIALAALQSPVQAADTKPAPKEELGRCYGVNSCKGESLCATAKNDCKGLNDCKGQGVIVKTRSECLAAGGTLTEPKQ